MGPPYRHKDNASHGFYEALSAPRKGLFAFRKRRSLASQGACQAPPSMDQSLGVAHPPTSFLASAYDEPQKCEREGAWLPLDPFSPEALLLSPQTLMKGSGSSSLAHAWTAF